MLFLFCIWKELYVSLLMFYFFIFFRFWYFESLYSTSNTTCSTCDSYINFESKYSISRTLLTGNKTKYIFILRFKQIVISKWYNKRKIYIIYIYIYIHLSSQSLWSMIADVFLSRRLWHFKPQSLSTVTNLTFLRVSVFSLVSGKMPKHRRVLWYTIYALFLN